jgi:hypothetical protein
MNPFAPTPRFQLETSTLTAEELCRLQWLRGQLAAQTFAACNTADHVGWDCSWQTARHLAYLKWLAVTGRFDDDGAEWTS